MVKTLFTVARNIAFLGKNHVRITAKFTFYLVF